MKLLVYGSLKKEHYNHHLLKDSEYLFDSNIPGYTLYSAGSYPVAISSTVKDHYIVGEVYEIDHNVWGIIYDMERYAGYNSKVYKDLHFFEYRNWLRAATKFKHIGSKWTLI